MLSYHVGGESTVGKQKMTPEEMSAKLDEVLSKYKGQGQKALMATLQQAQEIYGYLPLPVQRKVADALDVSVAEVYGVISFYSFFSLKPKGENAISVCLGTACYVKGAQQVIDKFSELLNIKPGETSEDGLFTLDALRCIGACGIAPAVSINGKVYPKVAVGQVAEIIDSYRKEASA